MVSLLPTIKVELNDFHKERIAFIDAIYGDRILFARLKKRIYSLIETIDEDIIKSYLPDSAIGFKGLNEDYFEQGLLALKQCYALLLLDPNNKCFVSKKVALFLHAHLTSHKAHKQFCEEVYDQAEFGQTLYGRVGDCQDPDACAPVPSCEGMTQTQLYSAVRPRFPTAEAINASR